MLGLRFRIQGLGAVCHLFVALAALTAQKQQRRCRRVSRLNPEEHQVRSQGSRFRTLGYPPRIHGRKQNPES